MRLVGLISCALFLTACSGSEDQPGTVTADEARQLNDAAAMLDANSIDLNAMTNEQDVP